MVGGYSIISQFYYVELFWSAQKPLKSIMYTVCGLNVFIEAIYASHI